MYNKKIKSFQFGKHEVTLETGRFARQATSSVLVSMNDTVVLATVVVAKTVKDGQDFFPLTVDYFEKNYAIGKIPGGYFKRETKPMEHEVLVARLIDRPLRPLFPEHFYNEVQIVVQVLSLNPEVSPDIPSIIAASAAVAISGLPLETPIGASRVGYVDGQFVLNPSKSELKNSQLDLVVAGTKQAVLMVESEAKELSEEIMLNAVIFGHEAMQSVIDAISEFITMVNPVLMEFPIEKTDEELLNKIKEIAFDDLIKAYTIRQKQLRNNTLDDIRKKAHDTLGVDVTDVITINKVNHLIEKLEYQIVRGKILNGEPRIDGRDTKTVRPINIDLSVLPRAHGSSLFTRGETQSLGIATLGTKMDEQTVDAILGIYSENFMLNYNFPPFSTGECGRMGPPKRREIGHGNLAKRALLAVLPNSELFPYTIRIVSEILESNGSSSMATVCSGCLSLMDAGVPIKNHVAGVAMGLILENNKFAILTDILGDEDHLGDMDFKVAGTNNGITALQMDIKIDGITYAIMQVALEQAKEGRLHILNIMKNVIEYPKVLSDRVPKIFKMQINPEKIKDVIGRGGAVIKNIIADAGATIDITDDGQITIASALQEGVNKAKLMIENIVAEVKVGDIYEGVVTKILDRNMGIMVAILGSREGFVHVSQISNTRVEDIKKVISEGQAVKVKVVEFDERGRMRLSIKATLNNDNNNNAKS